MNLNLCCVVVLCLHRTVWVIRYKRGGEDTGRFAIAYIWQKAGHKEAETSGTVQELRGADDGREALGDTAEVPEEFIGAVLSCLVLSCLVAKLQIKPK